MKTLTRRQMDVLRFIVAYWKRRAMAPSFTEMTAALGVNRSTVHEHVGELERKGYIRRSKGRDRTIEVLHDPEHPSTCPLCGHERKPAA